MPESVVSNAKLCPASTHSSISSSISRPALKEAVSGLNGAKPAAIKSALMKRSVWASAGKKSRANVVLPAPLGPAMMMIFFNISLSFYRFYALQCHLPIGRFRPIFLKISLQFVTKKDLLDLDSIDPSDPFMGHLGICAHDLMMTFTISV